MREPFKTFTPYIIIGIIIVILLFFMKCEKKPVINYTPLISAKDAKINRLLLELSVKKTDTLKIIKTKYKTKYDTTFVEVIKLAPDTCHYYIAKLDSACKKLDSANIAIITEQETQMIKYSEVVGLMQERNDMQEKRHITDSLEINKLDKKLNRTRKLAAVGIGAAFVGGLIIK